MKQKAITFFMVFALLALVMPAFAQVENGLVINEIMQNPAAVSDAAGEWLELYNPTDNDIDINGWTILDNDIDTHVINNGGPLIVPAGGYLVLGNNTDTATNGGVDIAYSYGPSWFLANGADEVVLLDGNGAEIDRVEYDGGPAFPDPNGASMALSDPTLDNNIGSNWCTSETSFGDGDLGTPGAANDCESEPPPPEEFCGDAYTPIYAVQGSGDISPLEGSVVSVEGVVVGDFQDGDGDYTDLGGFYIQDPNGDGIRATSDGIFVFAPGSMDVSAGDRVRVRGEVDEYFSLTEITDVSLLLSCSSGNSITPTRVSLPARMPDQFENFEGMLVTFPQKLYISEYFNFDRFGEIVLTTDRQYQPTAIFEPGSSKGAQLALNNLLGRITLDDGRSSQNPDPAIHPNGEVFDLNNLFRGGDVVRNVTGVMDFQFGLYRIQPTQGADYKPANPRPEQPEEVGGNLKVASFNVLNYFTTIDNGQDNCGPDEDQECRGADNQEEFERQRAKIIAALSKINADVVGLIEIENHPGDVPTADLVSGLNDALGAGTYEYVATGAIGTDAIRQAIIYKPATVSLVGGYAVLDSDEFVDPNNTGEPRNRPALAQTFMDNQSGEIFTTVVNHFKSKGSECGTGDDNAEQGNCNLTRTLSAQVLADWLATDPTGSGNAGVLIIGDLNSYDKEDPIDVLKANGFSDLIRSFQGEKAYSYVFDGQLGYLDYALANPALRGQVTGVTVWHINADEPDIIDYDTSFKLPAQDALYEPNAYRSSDHDPVIVGLAWRGH